MKKVLFIIPVFLLILLLSACSKTDTPGGYKIDNWVTSLGGVGADNAGFADESRYTYTFYITSGIDNLADVKEVTPVIGDNIKDRLIQNESPQITPKDSYLEVQGEIIFDTKGLTKEQIDALKPYIVSVRIMAESIVDLKQ